MIATPSYSIPKGVNSGVFGIVTGKYCKEVEDVIAFAKSKNYPLPSEYVLRQLSVLINELRANGIFQISDALYIPGLGDIRTDNVGFLGSGGGNDRRTALFYEFSLINFINPQQYLGSRLVNPSAIRINYPYYTKYGWINGQASGDGSADSGLIDTNYNPSAANNWTQNSACVSFFISALGVTSTTQLVTLGRLETNATVQCNLITSPDQARVMINTATGNQAGDLISISKRNGFFSCDRSASNLTTLYLDGVSVGSTVRASTNISAATQTVAFNGRLPFAANIRCQSQVSYIRFGSSIGAPLAKTEYEIYTNFRSKLWNE
jgi:hypothetical protein